MYTEKRSKNYHIMAMVDVFCQWITSFYFLLNNFIFFLTFYSRHIFLNHKKQNYFYTPNFTNLFQCNVSRIEN